MPGVRFVGLRKCFGSIEKEECAMTLPAKFNNVQYYLISGQYSFAGDLIVTRGVLYFFPHTDLEAQRIKNSSRHSGGGLVGGLVADAIYAGVDAAAMAAKGSYLSKHGLWHEGDTDEQFRQRADAHMVELKEQRKKERFSESLPIPTRIATDEIRNLKMGNHIVDSPSRRNWLTDS